MLESGEVWYLMCGGATAELESLERADDSSESDVVEEAEDDEDDMGVGLSSMLLLLSGKTRVFLKLLLMVEVMIVILGS